MLHILSDFLIKSDLFVESPLWGIIKGTVMIASLVAFVICALYYKFKN